jgi:hypothetical protein
MIVDMSQDLRENTDNALEQLQPNGNTNGTQEDKSGR